MRGRSFGVTLALVPQCTEILPIAVDRHDGGGLDDSEPSGDARIPPIVTMGGAKSRACGHPLQLETYFNKRSAGFGAHRSTTNGPRKASQALGKVLSKKNSGATIERLAP